MTSTIMNKNIKSSISTMVKGGKGEEKVIVSDGVYHHKGCECLLLEQRNDITSVFYDKCAESKILDSDWCMTDITFEHGSPYFTIYSNKIEGSQLQNILQDILWNHYGGYGYKYATIIKNNISCQVFGDMYKHSHTIKLNK